MALKTKDLSVLSKARFKIYTLGQFTVLRGEEVLNEQTNRSYRMWELFKYLLTHRGKGIPAESITETLWPDSDYSDPRRAVRAYIYRLRQILNDKECKNIVFSQGCYSWSAGDDCWLDSAEFERLTAEADVLLQSDTDRAIACLQRAIELYKGEYLPEITYSEWIIPTRHYYRRVFLEAVYKLTGLLQEKGSHQEISKICEKALMIEPYDEQLHLAYIESLLAENRYQHALRHYEYTTAMLYKELGIKPSQAMRAIYQRIQSGETASSAEGKSFRDFLQPTEEKSGAFFCQ